jgi:hypothetical protein
MLRELDQTGGNQLVSRENDYIEQLFREAAESLDLTGTQHAEAASAYESVGGWLDAPDSPLHLYRPLVCPQGSFSLGTVTKPLGRDDFDLDATCILNVPAGVTPADLKRMMGDRLRAHVVYRGMLEERPRCWRLNYSHNFHLDIIPAKPKYPATNLTPILITDKALLLWLDSDPKGYIAWFKIRKIVAPAILANRAAAKANVEPVPDQEEMHEKSPLQIAIQILKRHRDVTFQGRDDAPISIILTTLAGHAYQQERTIFATLRALIERMPLYIDRSLGYPCITNPTNAGENFADKWRTNPDREAAFYEWNSKALKHLDALVRATGLNNVRSALLPFFGGNRTDIVLNRMAERTNMRRSSGLKVDTKTGLVGVSTGIIVPGANFYGDQLFQP